MAFVLESNYVYRINKSRIEKAYQIKKIEIIDNSSIKIYFVTIGEIGGRMFESTYDHVKGEFIAYEQFNQLLMYDEYQSNNQKGFRIALDIESAKKIQIELQEKYLYDQKCNLVNAMNEYIKAKNKFTVPYNTEVEDEKQ